MILKVRVVPGAKLRRIQEQGQGFLKVHLSAPARDNRANKALIIYLSQYYKVKKARIFIIRGEYSQDKIVEIKEKEEREK